MKFGLVGYISVGVSIDNRDIITSLSNDLENHFLSKTYGEGLKTCVIGVICVAPEFEEFHKVKKPKYTQGKKVLKMHGISTTIEDILTYRIKIDFEAFKNADDENAKKILAQNILTSLTLVENMKSKIKDFNVEQFIADVKEYFTKSGLL